MAGKLADKNAIITGGSSGLGYSIAIDFVKEDLKTLVLVSSNFEKLKQAAKKISEYGKTEIIIYQLDVGKEEEWKSFVGFIKNKVKKIDILVNNAGVNKRDTIANCSVEDWEKIINVNQTGVFLGMKYCLELLKESEKGSVINLSSITGLTGYFAFAYTASKWAVRGMTKSAAIEFGKWGIRSNSIHPGYIDTPLNENIKDLITVTNDMNPLERPGEPEEIAKAATFLASDDSSFMTGAELVIDGGLTSGGQFKLVADKFKIY